MSSLEFSEERGVYWNLFEELIGISLKPVGAFLRSALVLFRGACWNIFASKGRLGGGCCAAMR
jgi:hypothetical protein